MGLVQTGLNEKKVKGAGVREQDGRTLGEEPEALKGEAWWDDKKELNWGKGMRGQKGSPSQ